MSQHQRPAADEVEPGIPATSELPRDIPPGSEDEEEPAPLDFPQGVETWGTTAEEELQGEPFELRLRREEPDVLPGAGGGEGGLSLIEPGSEDGYDDEPDAVAELDPEWQPASAEEAAMRIEEEPAGLTYDAGPGYLDDE